MSEACEREEELEGHVKIKPLSTGSIDFPKGKKKCVFCGCPLQCPFSLNTILLTLTS